MVRPLITNIEQGRQRVLLHQMYEIAAPLDADVSQLVQKLEPKAEPPLRPDVAKLVKDLQSETSNGT